MTESRIMCGGRHVGACVFIYARSSLMRTFLADSLGADVCRVLHMSLCMSSGCQCLISQPVAQNLLGDVPLVFNVSLC